MLSLLKAIIILALLGVPVLVVLSVPRFMELASSVPAPTSVPLATSVPFRLDATSAPSRFVGIDSSAPPPTLAAPAATATAQPTPRPTPTGERVVVANTDGRGAVLRAEPVTGRPVAALHEEQILDVLERRNVPGSGDWLRVRAADGAEGWITGLVARPAPGTTP
ncbi:MAG: hypothetical protein JOZ81_19660 [Chloroflexi bacterium]|nr:hypothetical protein [Chloroflexota bacterium]MBV9547984.1 hypothetical protein [Chloroflexota bacterium]